MNRRLFAFRMVPLLVMVLGLLVTSSVFGADRYRVAAQFFHLGELIAQPVIDVEEGETIGGTYSVAGQGEFTFVVLVRPASDDEVFVSLQFTSGKIKIQPNLLVSVGKETSATIDKVRLTLLVMAVEEQPENIETRPIAFL